MRRTPALIVGGGPAGSAAAIRLAQGGIPPLLVERTAGAHDTVCGGFTGWDALAALRRIGVVPEALGARPITRLRVVAAGRTAEADLPHQAAGLSRRTLDEVLLAAAREAGAEVLRGRTARAVEDAPLRFRLDEEELEGEQLFLATGKHELRGHARPVNGGAVGLRTALEPSPAMRGALEGLIELHLYDGGYAGLLLQDDGRANLCLSVSAARLKSAGGRDGLLGTLADELPLLRARLDDSEAGEWSAISGVPYGWRAGKTLPGIYRIGDQGAVVASLAGDGIAIALESGIAAADALLAGEGAQTYQRRFSARSRRPLAVAESLRWAAERSAPRAAMMQMLRWFPGIAPLAARLTRIGGTA
ncbi:MAG TPA: FAD-dependent monooxygenase [Allosphingosinicella sp.]